MDSYQMSLSNSSLSRDFDVMMLLILKQHVEKLQSEAWLHSRFKKKFYKQLDRYQRRLRDRRIPRVALQYPSISAWEHLKRSGNDQALITLTGLDFETFDWLLQMYRPIHDNYSPWIDPDGKIVRINNKFGRKRLIKAEDTLGLNLAWTRTKGQNMLLQIVFGLTATPLSMYLRFGRRILIKVLKNNTDAAIKIPSDDEIEKYKATINEFYPNLNDVWCTMDGIKLLLQKAGDSVDQNMFYNGWTHDHYFSALICFCPDGTIPICCYNVPGSIHDSMIAEWGNVYAKLEQVFNRTGGMCTVDSAFARKAYPFLIKSSQTIDPEQENGRAYTRAHTINKEATSMRQAAEWGMRALQASFPRLKDRFIYETFGERRIILKMMFLVYNLRARRVGINQIKSFYLNALDRDANQYFQPQQRR